MSTHFINGSLSSPVSIGISPNSMSSIELSTEWSGTEYLRSDTKYMNNTLEVTGKIKSTLTDALSILYSKSKNITEEKREWAQKIVDIHADLEYHNEQIKKLNKEFEDLTNPKEKKDCCSK